ncbi:MAG TPA: aldehyde dehydrogenase (NADP(+)) [Ohtaekwangia sp.]
MTIEGKQIIGFEQVATGTESFQSVNPALGIKLEYRFFKATEKEVNQACEKAAAAFQVYRKKSGTDKALFLEAIANEIKALGDQLIDTCCTETALPKARIEGERGRTMNQLLMFAAMLREGSWLDARIETADPARTPIPKPDIRYMHVGMGPVVVFGASNFPLAFSVAGGDTASALAAGCPVIVKAHSAHPATGELVGKAIQKAARATGMPDGVFSLLHGDGSVVGTLLVKHAEVKAVGLTGSFKAGKALFDIAANRDVPIPVYAEMGSTNPVFILPETMQANREKIAQGFSGSVTLGVGQFCTNPGLLIYESKAGAKEFTQDLKEQFQKTSGGAMLAENIFKSYTQGVTHHTAVEGMEVFAQGIKTEGTNIGNPILFKTTSNVFDKHDELAEEIFGPTSVVIEAKSKEEILSIARNLSGHLTATVHGTEKDLIAYKELLDILEQKVGRIVINGFPTGVEVCHAMVHGGPYPATTDGRSTSVGTASIFRFTRAVSYQGMPQALLPDELKNDNPLQVWRLVNGERTKSKI